MAGSENVRVKLSPPPSLELSYLVTYSTLCSVLISFDNMAEREVFSAYQHARLNHIGLHVMFLCSRDACHTKDPVSSNFLVWHVECV